VFYVFLDDGHQCIDADGDPDLISLYLITGCFIDLLLKRWDGSDRNYLILDAKGHDALPAFSAAMSLLVVPMTMVALTIFAMRAWCRQQATSPGMGSWW